MFIEKRTEKKEELSAHFRNEIFEMMVNRASEIIILFTVDDSTVNYVSPNIDRLLGITTDDFKENFALLDATAIEPTVPYTEEELLRAAAQTGGQLRARLHQKTGETRWFQEHVLRGRFQDSKKFLLLLSDRTNEVIAQERLKEALSIAQSANEVKSTFLANMSHDIRTPMNAIIGFSHLLDQEWQFPDKAKEYTQKIAASSKQMLSLINDMLDMSRLESGSTVINMSPFNLRDFMEELKVNILPQFKVKNLDFEMEINGLQKEMYMADKARLSQILTNILTNSVRYTPEGGHIKFTVTQLNKNPRKFSHLRFEVADSGIGISEDFLEHVFEPFAREKNTTLSGVAGTGLGLAIVKNLVDLLGGTIHVESEKNVGTTFTVELELQLADQGKYEEVLPVKAETEAEADTDEKAMDNILSGLRILAAEDNELNAEILEELLKMEGAQCDIGENGQVTLDMFKASEPGYYDVILLDVQMPVMDGHEAARAIRACGHPDAKKIPITAMTANAFAEDVQAALDAGMDAHIAKPADLDVLKAELYWLLKKRTEK